MYCNKKVLHANNAQHTINIHSVIMGESLSFSKLKSKHWIELIHLLINCMLLLWHFECKWNEKFAKCLGCHKRFGTKVIIAVDSIMCYSMHLVLNFHINCLLFDSFISLRLITAIKKNKFSKPLFLYDFILYYLL